MITMTLKTLGRTDFLLYFDMLTYFYSFTSTKIAIKKLSNEYTQNVLDEFKRVINPTYHIVVERDCNYTIFNEYLTTDKVRILKMQNNGNLEVDCDLTKKYLNSQMLPSDHQYALLSPYIDASLFPSYNSAYFTFNVKSMINGKILGSFLKILEHLRMSRLDNIENNVIKFNREFSSNYELVNFELKGSGVFTQTYYYKEDEIINKLFNIKLKNLQYSHFLDYVTHELIDILKHYDIFTAKFNIEEYPDVIPLIFPFKFVEKFNGNNRVKQLYTIGFDLRNCLTSNLSFLFNKDKINQLVKRGGVWCISTTWTHGY